MGFVTGLYLASVTVAFTMLLEIFCINRVIYLLSKEDGKALYRKALVANIVNNMLIGPVTYAVCTRFYVNKDDHDGHFTKFVQIVGIILIHAIGYFQAHWMMHKYMYHMHKFHHRFNKIVLPSTANAVSSAEYIFAYMLPFLIASHVVNPSADSLIASATFISVNNILIHTPFLREISKTLPKWAVSTNDHMQHHQSQTKNYSAPTINLDKILGI